MFVASYKCPRLVNVLAEPPKSATGKILKPPLSKLVCI